MRSRRRLIKEETMKKLLSVLLATCTLLSLAACNKKESGDKIKPSTPANTIAFATYSYDKQISNIKPKGSTKESTKLKYSCTDHMAGATVSDAAQNRLMASGKTYR